MKYPTRRALLALATFIGAMTLGDAAPAQPAFPSKPIRVIIPYPAGGVGDVFARVVTDVLAKHWSQPIIIDARPGASGNIGNLAAMQSEPDGYTWLLAGPGLTANPSLFKNAGWNASKDFAGLGVIAYAPMLLVVNDKVPAKTLRDVAEMAHAKPGTVSAGVMNGSSNHFIIEAFKQAGDAQFLMVPYKGAPPIVTDLVSGVVQISVLPLTVAQPQVQAGRLRALGIASPTRSPLLPEVPTFAEGGYAEGALVPWYGFVVPRATPAAIVKQINAAMNEALKSPELRERLAKLGGDAGKPMTPAEVDALIKSDADKYARLVKRGNIAPE
jgi:tripartite-type tricarboxylate transporter receptor subunit TctC